MYHALIVEDDEREKLALEHCLERYGDEYGATFQISWIRSALEFMETRPEADVIFMDIEMPGITGMEAAEHLRSYDASTPLVFVTNLAQYAVHGYAVDATDFIVKPVQYGPFALRMGRVMRAMARSRERTVSVQTRDGLRLFPLSDLVYVSVDGHYLQYHLVGGQVLRARGTLKQAESDLAGGDLVRASNNELVNMAHILRMDKDSLALDSGETIWFSRARKKEAQVWIARFLGGA